MKSYIQLFVILIFANGLIGQINVQPENPKVGEETTVTFAGEQVEKLFITYRPNSQVEIKDSIAVNGQNVQWIPKNPGVVSLMAGSSSKNVSIRFTNLSWSGIGVMLLAFIILFGGAGLSFYILFSTDNDENLDPNRMADT